MDFRELFLTQHARAFAAEVLHADMSYQDNLLRDVTDEQIRQRPQPGFNSLAWLLWHVTRVEDASANLIIAERPQVFDEGGWGARLNVPRRDIGTGMTEPEVDEFNRQIDIAALLAYRAAVGQQTQAIVRDLQPEVLDEVIDRDLVQRLRDEGIFSPRISSFLSRWEGKRKEFTLANSVLAHSFLTFGEAFGVRNLLGLPTP